MHVLNNPTNLTLYKLQVTLLVSSQHILHDVDQS